MKIIKHRINLNNEIIYFFAPEGDDCAPGTLMGIQKNDWKLDKIDFKNNDVFVDIGCNIGLISILVAKLFPFVRIFSFDANPLAIECLKLACQENKIKNINPYNLAIGAENRDVDFVTYSENETCTVQKEISNLRAITYKTKMICPELLFQDILKSNVKYLKCDIEGGEFQLFDYIFEKQRGILDKIEFLHLEIHPFDDSNPPTKKLKQKLQEKFGNKLFY